MPSFSNSAGPVRRRFFPLPPDQWDAARSWIEHGERTPRKPRHASSVVLIRDTPSGVETYLTYRPGGSPLGIVAFPGGTLEEADNDPVRWFGPTPAEWAAVMDMADHALARAHVVAAIRELFEETGILLAGSDSTSLVEGNLTGDWMQAREAIATQEKSFAELLNRRGLGLRTDLIKALTNWVSPDFAHRRFDTRYFAVVQPVSQRTALLESKGVWGQWKCAAQVVAEGNSSALGDEIGQENTVGRTLSQLTVPAVEVTLEKIASCRGCIAYMSHRRTARTYKPALAARDNGLYLEVETPAALEGGSLQRGR